MALRIFIKFRTDQVPGPPVEKDLLVATAACLKLLGHKFDFKRDFIHAQGEVLQEKPRATCWSTTIITIPGLIQEMLSYISNTW